VEYPKLMSAEAMDGYRLRLRYANGENRMYDFAPHLAHKYYKPLEDTLLFRSVRVDDGELIWASGQDFCPHTLYDGSKAVRQTVDMHAAEVMR